MMVEIAGGPAVSLSIGIWSVMCAFLGGTAVNVIAAQHTTRRQLLCLAAWSIVMAAILLVTEGAQRELASLLYVLTHPGTSSVGIWCSLPFWPAIAGTIAGTALVFGTHLKKRKKIPLGTLLRSHLGAMC